MKEEDQGENPTPTLEGQMEEERQPIVQVVEGAIVVKLGVTKIKEGENFKNEETIKIQMYIVKSSEDWKDTSI